MKGWTLLGVLLAVAGVVVFLNGLNNRLAQRGNTTITKTSEPSLAPDDSPKIATTKQENSDSERSTENAPPLFTLPSEKLKEVAPIPLPNNSPDIETTGKGLVMGDQSETLVELADPRFSNDPDGRKYRLVKTLREAKWSVDELEQLTSYLEDPRAVFRSEILVRNSTFTENAEQYSHNLTIESINRSLQFLQDNREAFEAARKNEGVPSEILVAILKVETNLGEWRGKESVFNVFWSLALGDNSAVQRSLLTEDPAKAVEMKARMIKRANWARGQLRDLLFVAKHGGENPVGILGSFAGAFGLPQFIPSSYRSFGQDGNGDGIIDLDGIPDATRSIGYYLKENGWPNRPDRARMRKSILNYNHSSFYADCVLSLADSLSMRLNGALIAN